MYFFSKCRRVVFARELKRLKLLNVSMKDIQLELIETERMCIHKRYAYEIVGCFQRCFVFFNKTLIKDPSNYV